MSFRSPKIVCTGSTGQRSLSISSVMKSSFQYKYPAYSLARGVVRVTPDVWSGYVAVGRSHRA